jgi:hypothetical protein
MNRTRILSAAAGLLLPLVVAGSTVHAQQNDSNQNFNQNGNFQGNNLSSTPELDSVLLFGSGVTGLVGYALIRVRATRRPRNSP